MIELVIAACLATGECKESRLTYDAQEVSLMTCIVAGQTEVARRKENIRIGRSSAGTAVSSDSSARRSRWLGSQQAFSTPSFAINADYLALGTTRNVASDPLLSLARPDRSLHPPFPLPSISS
ncbi:MAG: hypothetical protein E5X80_10560 [Mesorhizobium sp.]|uniref:hypothetical protein n=1 Tax=Mesorhizobium sp. TaxID=1871066 RepID=UPI0012130544|nr:hypothetical protein [Mesorhizobium sp.]TIO48832.1 MAG: hypothetical protein E5X78_28035 [Mesorhizobium sp.]TIO59735.1 MAG: hypothetical protein E5X79_15430 [Mesorhizobium sp.]TJV65510.1 MAG: hypothetical protein E5X80_10560 [Mesorhizobium sp.]